MKMTRYKAMNIIAGIIMANDDFGATEKQELLDWLRHVEETAAELDE